MSGRVRLPPPFEERARGEQVARALVGSSLLGAVAGLVLGWSAAAYVVVQVVATVGGLLAGVEHAVLRVAALRGLVGGLVYGGVLLAVHAATGADETVSLGSTPGLLPVVTGVLGALLACGGAVARSRLARG